MKRLSRGFFGALLICLAFSGSSFASNIVIKPGAVLSGNAAALSAFNRAAASWGKLFSDPISVTINAELAALGPGILGSTSSVLLQGGFNTIRNQMVADAADETSNAIVTYLPTTAQFSAYVPAGFGLDGNIAGTKANFKAMGFAGLDVTFGESDATMTFSTNFSFDYDNSNGVGAGLYDFETVAAHEIGHVLGFVSAVDRVDDYLSQGQTISTPLYALDLFRFGTNTPTDEASFTTTPRSLLTGGTSYFSDVDNTWSLSTGRYTGDGNQASHWKADELTGTYIGLMDPTLASATIEDITGADIRAFDVIGWDVKPVPIPPTLVLFGTGMIALIAGTRRRTKK